MDISPEGLAGLKKIQELVAPHDPSILELDPSDREDAKTIMLMGALLAAVKGTGDLTISLEEEGGRTETITVQSMGTSSNGEPVTALSVSSSDGVLAPKTAGLVADLAEEPQTEIDHLAGE